jgi:DNA invertase Pin-like site-specific DNA recombinase
VDLRGRLSNPLIAGKVREAGAAVAGVKGADPEATRAISRGRRWRIVDRMGQQIINDLIADRSTGVSKAKLAERYGISLSSVKRLLHKKG